MGIFEELKSVGKTLQDMGKLNELRQLLDAERLLLETQKRVSELETENSRLKDLLIVKGQVVYKQDRHELFWLKPDNGPERGPYCGACWGDKAKLIPLTQGTPEGYHKCAICKNAFFFRLQ